MIESENQLAHTETKASEPQSTSGAAASSLELISKSVAVFAVILYGCGYLITSLCHSEYGFIEMSPLRPRIVAAGAWYLFFVAAAVGAVKGVLKSADYLQTEGKPWLKFSKFLYLQLVASVSLSFFLQWIFDFDVYPEPPSSSVKSAIVLAVALLSVVAFVVLTTWKRIPRPLVAGVLIVFVGFCMYSNAHELFVNKRFEIGAISLWFFSVGIIALLEMRARSWKPEVGDWTWTTMMLLGTLFVFSSAYYPHLKSSWGGGQPIPITVYLTKDSAVLPNQVARAFLVDESDSGLYVVSGRGKKAIFLPRNAIGLVYFSDNPSELSLGKQK